MTPRSGQRQQLESSPGRRFVLARPGPRARAVSADSARRRARRELESAQDGLQHGGRRAARRTQPGAGSHPTPFPEYRPGTGKLHRSHRLPPVPTSAPSNPPAPEPRRVPRAACSTAPRRRCAGRGGLREDAGGQRGGEKQRSAEARWAAGLSRPGRAQPGEGAAPRLRDAASAQLPPPPRGQHKPGGKGKESAAVSTGKGRRSKRKELLGDAGLDGDAGVPARVPPGDGRCSARALGEVRLQETERGHSSLHLLPAQSLRHLPLCSQVTAPLQPRTALPGRAASCGRSSPQPSLTETSRAGHSDNFYLTNSACWSIPLQPLAGSPMHSACAGPESRGKPASSRAGRSELHPPGCLSA